MDLKIMIVNNNPKFEYNKSDQIGWNLLPSLYVKKGAKVLGVAKKDFLSFYSLYKKFNPDIIETTWVPGGAIPLFFKKLGLIKCPILHSYDEQSYVEQMPNYPSSIIRFLEKFTIKNSDYFTTVSKTNEKFLRSIGKKVYFIPHGYFKSKEKKTSIDLNFLRSRKSNLKIIYLGEQNKIKKVDKLIEAVKGLNCDLFLFGKINEEFKKIASTNVHFMGWVNPTEVNSVLKQADILANPSDMDVNYKFIEYIKAKKPIFAFDGVAKAVFKHKENAYLTRDFRKGLIELIKDKELRKKLESNVKKLQIYCWEEIVDMRLNLYRKIVSKGI